MRLRLFAIAMVLFFSSPSIFAADKEDLRGRWKLIASEVRLRPDDAAEELEIEFGEEVLVVNSKVGEHRTKYLSDGSKEPGQIEWIVHDEDGTRTIVRGIYRLRGRKLEICVRIGDGDDVPARPIAFESDRLDDCVQLLTFRRLK